MGDALVDRLPRKKCTECGGHKFRVVMYGPEYDVDTEKDESCPTLDTPYLEIKSITCRSCGRRMRVQ